MEANTEFQLLRTDQILHCQITFSSSKQLYKYQFIFISFVVCIIFGSQQEVAFDKLGKSEQSPFFPIAAKGYLLFSLLGVNGGDLNSDQD